MPPCYKAHCCKASSVPYMPPCYKAHCCKASSVPYASLLQDSLLQAPLPAYLASVLCVIIAFIQRCVGLCFIPVMVWSGLCFIPRRSGLVWSGLVCVLYPTSWRVTRRWRPDPLAEEVATRVSEDSGIAGLQLGRFLQMVQEEVQEEMQAQQARLLGSSSNNGNAVVFQPPPATCLKVRHGGGRTYRPGLVHVEKDQCMTLWFLYGGFPYSC